MRPLLRILGLWRRRWAWLVLGLLVSLASVASGVALLALAGAHVATLLLGAAAAAGALLTVLGPVRVVLRYLERLSTHSATFRALADLRVWFFSGLARRSAGGLGMQRSGDVTARLVGDVEALDGLYLRIIIPLAAALMLLPILAFVLIGEGGVDWIYGVGVVVLFAAAALVVPLLAASRTGRAGQLVANNNAALRVAVVDMLAGLRDVRAFGAESRLLGAMQVHDAAATDAAQRLAGHAAVAQAAGFLCAQAALLLVLLGSGVRPVYAVGAAFLVIAAFEAAGGLPRAGALAGRAAASATRVLAAATATPAVVEPTSPAPLPTGTAVRFEQVAFRYGLDREPVFQGLSFDVPQGARVAVLGPSGGGKSTIAALLLKVVAPEAGRILLGGVDIATLPSPAVRSRIGWLSQATHLFDDTVRANLLLGRPDADDAALWRALDEAEIGDVVRALPDQLDAWLGESGSRLSGGQGRRIALARTLLSQAPILILDEPCAGLDAQTERAFLQTLNTLASGRTLILIAHRLTGVEQLDRIWRLSSGHAVAAAA